MLCSQFPEITQSLHGPHVHLQSLYERLSHLKLITLTAGFLVLFYESFELQLLLQFLGSCTHSCLLLHYYFEKCSLKSC